MNANTEVFKDKILTLNMLRSKCTGVIEAINRMDETSGVGLLSAEISKDFDLIRNSTSSLYPSCKPFLPPSIPHDEYNRSEKCSITVDEIDMYFRQMVGLIDSAISDLEADEK